MKREELTALVARFRICGRVKSLSNYAMAIFEKASKFALDKPAGQEIPDHSKRQLITNAIAKDAGASALRIHFMGVFPTAERAGDLDVAELASFDVIAMFEGPTNFEWTHLDAQCAAVAVTNSWRSLQDFDGLPRRGEAIEGVGLGVPSKNFFGGRVDSRLGDEMKLVRHRC
jgi:hypothetical protein